jgi:hypothetical protein
VSDPRELAATIAELREAVWDFGEETYSLPPRDRVRLLRRIGELALEGLQSAHHEMEDALEDEG